MRILASVLLAAVVLPGCSGDDGGGGGSSSGSTPPAPPTCEAGQVASGGACRPAGWASCPDGFTAAEAGCRAIVPAAACPDGQRPRLGSATCEPLAALTCPSGFAQDGLGCKEIVPATRCTGATRDALGQTSCVPLGDCNAAVAGATLFVDPNGPVDATHFKTIGNAVAGASAGAVIAVASGTYKESVAITKSVTIAGACAANVVLDGEDTPARTAVTVSGNVDVALRGLTITRYEGPVRTGGGSRTHVTDTLFSANHGAAATATDAGTTLTVEKTAVRGTVAATGTTNALGSGNGASLTVKDSSLVGNADKSISAKGGTLVVDHVLVADTALDPSGAFGSGIVVLGGTTATVTATAIVNARSEGLYSEGTLTMSGSVVRGTKADGTGDTVGSGLNLWRGTSTLSEITVDASRWAGVYVDRKATMTGDHLVVRDTGTDAASPGSGIVALGGSTATVKRAIVLRSKEQGLQAEEAGSTLTIQDAYVAGGRGAADGTAGDAAFVSKGGTLVIEDSALVDAQEATISASDAGSKLVAKGCVVADTRSNVAKKGGLGARVGGGASMSVERTAMVRNKDLGAIAQDAGSSLTLTDVEISGTTPAAAGSPHGRGVELKKGAAGTLTRVSLVGNTQGALVASSGATLSVTDVEIAHTKPSADGSGGRGITLQTGATATVTSTAVVDSSEIGIAVVGEGSALTLTDSVVQTTHGNGGDFGHGVVSATAAVTATHTRVEGSDAAAFAFADSRAAITACVVTKNGVGVFVNDGGSLQQVTGAPALPDDVGTVLVSEDTQFVENQTRVGSGVLPLPAVLD